MARSDRFPSGASPLRARIARKIFLNFVLPLIILVVAGILVPAFIWFSLDGFRVEYEERARLVDQTVALRKAALETADAWRNYRRYGDSEFRNQIGEARDLYQAAYLDIIPWLEERPVPTVSATFTAADDAFRLWLRTRTNPERRDVPSIIPRAAPTFDQVEPLFDTLIKAATAERVSAWPMYRRSHLFRRAAAAGIPLLALLLALLIGRAIALGITRPIEALTHATLELERGDWNALPPLDGGGTDPDDEIGDLQRSFRNMARAIGQREAVLRAQNDALAAIRRRIESVLNATNDGIVMLDRAGGFSVVNRRFAYFFGLEPEEIQDHTFDQVRPLLLARFKDRDQVRDRLRDVLRDPEAVADEVFDIVHPVARTLRLFSAPVRGESDRLGAPGELLGRIVVLRDVTREVEVDRMKTEFVSTVSHELRTPLTAIRGYVDLIVGGQTGPVSELQREFLTMVQGSTQRLTSLIDDILDIARIESGRVEIRRETVAYWPLIEQTARMLTGEAEAQKVTLNLVPPADGAAALPVLGDSERITQVLVNLISNALKYTPAGGQVTVSATFDGGIATTCVADTGIGIVPEDRERIFQKFFRADNSTTRETGGTGLGLAITRAVIERLGGSIWVESIPGKGSQFWFTLPVTGSDLAPEVSGAASTSKRRRLYLIADSDTTALHRIAHALRHQEVIASAAASAAEALRRARGLRPDAILMDPLTAGFDALQLARDLRTDPQTAAIPLVFYRLAHGSGQAAARDTLWLLPAPADDVERTALTDAVRHILVDVLHDGPTRASALVVLCGDALLATIQEARQGLKDGAALVASLDPQEADRRLGPARPLLLVVDTTAVTGDDVGTFLRSVQERHPSLRIPILLLLDGTLWAPDIVALAPLGKGPVPVGRLARATRSVLSPAEKTPRATAGKSGGNRG
jgi:PAS domain S-box-containing protein